jgi:hypothetical protein
MSFNSKLCVCVLIATMIVSNRAEYLNSSQIATSELRRGFTLVYSIANAFIDSMQPNIDINYDLQTCSLADYTESLLKHYKINNIDLIKRVVDDSAAIHILLPGFANWINKISQNIQVKDDSVPNDWTFYLRQVSVLKISNYSFQLFKFFHMFSLFLKTLVLLPGVAAFVLSCLVFLVLVPLSGLIYSCISCCCSKKQIYDKKHDKIKRRIISVIIFGLLVLFLYEFSFFL